MNAFFSDLDGTLIYTKRSLADIPDGELTPVEFTDGAAAAWMTTAAADALVALRDRAELVPTTTRTISQFNRITLPGGPTRYAIIANGGRILVDGVEDLSWTQRVNDQYVFEFTEPDIIANAIATLVDGDPSVKRVYAAQNVVNIVGNRGFKFPPDFYPAAQKIADDNGYTLYPQGRKAYLIPSHITKEAAAAEVADRLFTETGVDPVTFAAGDHGLDAGMMLWADAACQPAHGANIPSVPVTIAAGARAAEEIVVAAAAAFAVNVPA